MLTSSGLEPNTIRTGITAVTAAPRPDLFFLCPWGPVGALSGNWVVRAALRMGTIILDGVWRAGNGGGDSFNVGDECSGTPDTPHQGKEGRREDTTKRSDNL